MLILTRRTSESIIIGEGENKIVIRILSTRGRQVQIGIDAPKHITVHREEIFERIKHGQPTAVNED